MERHCREHSWLCGNYIPCHLCDGYGRLRRGKSLAECYKTKDLSVEVYLVINLGGVAVLPAFYHNGFHHPRLPRREPENISQGSWGR